MHIGKTAGTTLYKLLLSTFADVPTFHHDVKSYDVVEPAELRKYGLLIGHFSFHHTAKFAPGKFLFTFLRDPVERVISTYSALKTRERTPDDGDNGIRISAAKSLSFSDFIRSELTPVKVVVRNMQTNVLGGDWRKLPDVAPDDLAGRALKNMQTLSFVGITERYDEDVSRLFKKMGVKPPKRGSRQNVTPRRLKTSDIDPADIAYLKDANALDFHIYNTALRAAS
jgi:hypothetical protein